MFVTSFKFEYLLNDICIFTRLCLQFKNINSWELFKRHSLHLRLFNTIAVEFKFIFVIYYFLFVFFCLLGLEPIPCWNKSFYTQRYAIHVHIFAIFHEPSLDKVINGHLLRWKRDQEELWFVRSRANDKTKKNKAFNNQNNTHI